VSKALVEGFFSPWIYIDLRTFSNEGHKSVNGQRYLESRKVISLLVERCTSSLKRTKNANQ